MKQYTITCYQDLLDALYDLYAELNIRNIQIPRGLYFKTMPNSYDEDMAWEDFNELATLLTDNAYMVN